MDDLKLHDLAAWITEAGLVGTEETAMLAGFCERALATGLPLGSLTIVVDTLHPTAHHAAYLAWAYVAVGQHDRAIRLLRRFAQQRLRARHGARRVRPPS